MNQQPRTWREFLAGIIADTREKKRIADELGIGTRTLDRWAHGSVPRSSRLLSQLVETLPQHRELLTELIRRDPEFADFSPVPVFIEKTPEELPASFYGRVLEANSNIAGNLRFQAISTLILQQSLQLLDPDRSGLEISIVQCMPLVRGQKVRSLLERLRITSKSQESPEERLLYLGAGSLAGHVVAKCQFVIIQDVQSDHTFLPMCEERQSGSIAAYPVQRGGRVAGCLLATNAQTSFFTRPRQALLKSYAHLLVLAFNQEDFYSTQDIALGVIPPASTQTSLISSFRERVINTITEALRRDQLISSLEAELLVQRQIESELLNLATRNNAAGL